MQIYQRLSILWDWFMRPTCAFCGDSASGKRLVCESCERALPALGPHCSVCATPLPGDIVDTLICGQCQQRPRRYASVHAPFHYAAPIDRLILGAKYHGRFDWLEILGRRLAEHLDARADAVDAIVPVPLHRSRLRSRGYNQSLELARPVSKHLGIPLHLGVERVRATPPQSAMSGAERRRNVRDAFTATADFEGLRIALVDDVMTSGATAEAVIRCLRKAGAISVEIWVVARA